MFPYAYGHLAKDANGFGILFPSWQAQEESKINLDWERASGEEGCPHPSL